MSRARYCAPMTEKFLKPSKSQWSASLFHRFPSGCPPSQYRYHCGLARLRGDAFCRERRRGQDLAGSRSEISRRRTVRTSRCFLGFRVPRAKSRPRLCQSYQENPGTGHWLDHPAEEAHRTGQGMGLRPRTRGRGQLILLKPGREPLPISVDFLPALHAREDQ